MLTTNELLDFVCGWQSELTARFGFLDVVPGKDFTQPGRLAVSQNSVLGSRFVPDREPLPTLAANHNAHHDRFSDRGVFALVAHSTRCAADSGCSYHRGSLG